MVFWIGVVLWVLVGGELAAVATGAVELGSGSGVARFVIGINLAPWTAMAAWGLVYAGRRRRAGLTPTGPLSPAVARVESAKATGEGPDHQVRLDLTVAPAGQPAYRVHTSARVNVMDLDRFRAGRTVPVEYDPARPWHVRVVPADGSEWTAEVRLAKIDTAPAATRRSEPPHARPALWPTVLPALAAGAALYVVCF
ncbi:DUF3592 domain-containing protein [Kitasatospora cinereorecta]|uniref:DUF3592 domain-containing protein n=1 Tax=Kitasatospora cinereorecta TaxID=285560 RepID=A0ABW0V514_9ACTN